jgi:polysaccharide pyruvyl transferase WcaK-like protein
LEFTREDRVYPDLAFSYSSEEIVKASPEAGAGKVVGVSPIAYLAKSGWPDQDEAVHNPYIEALLFLVHTLLKRGYSVVLFSSDGPDREIVNEMVEALVEREGPEVTGRLNDPSTATLPELMGQLGTLDYVVASRLHGVLLSHRFCLPVLAVSYDRKVDTYMADVGLSQYCVDIHSVDGESLLRAFDGMTQNSAAIRATLFQINQRYARDLQQQYDAVLGQYEKRDTP